MSGLPALKLLASRTCIVNATAGLLMCSRVASCGNPCINTSLCRSVSYLSDPANTGKRTSGVNFDTLGAWNNRLSLPINMEESIRRGQLIPMIFLEDVGIASLQGRRLNNEDRTVACMLAPNLMMFGIFDGHGGCDAAEYVQQHLPGLISQCLDNGESDLVVALRRSFVDVNNGFTRLLHYQQANGSRPSTPASKSSADNKNLTSIEYDAKHSPIASARALSPSASSSGTTATVCLVKNGVELVVGHVGDSRALLCRKDTAVQLTEDHDPELTSERDRIERCRGKIVWSSIGRPRVNGILEMTRSIGDVELKRFGVSAEPDVRSLTLRHGSDAYVVLTTDGIHGVLNSEEIVNTVSECIDAHEAAKLLADHALLYGSSDNCTALVVPFGAWGKLHDGVQPRRAVRFTRANDYCSNRT